MTNRKLKNHWSYADGNLCAAMRAPKERFSETIFTLNIMPLYSKPVLVSFEISGSISESIPVCFSFAKFSKFQKVVKNFNDCWK